jgi:hypothetical protein
VVRGQLDADQQQNNQNCHRAYQPSFHTTPPNQRSF